MSWRVFIGSSAEAIPYADAVMGELERKCEVTPWYAGTFNSTNYTMEDLEATLNNKDFAIFICSPDDVAEIRGKSYYVTRDNTLFEMGLFWGKLKRGRVFFLIPANVRSLDDKSIEYHLLSDLTGIEPFRYQIRQTDSNYRAAVRTASNNMLNIMQEKGHFNDIEKEYNDLVSSQDQMKVASTYSFEVAKSLLKASKSALTKIEILEEVVNIVTTKFYTHNGFRVTGVGLWEGNKEENIIDHIVGKVGKTNSYSLGINDVINSESILVVDCFLKKVEVGFFKLIPFGSTKYILCYPLQDNYVLAVNIQGNRKMSDLEYNTTFFLNNMMIEVINLLLKEV